jgi:hypothetical protein
MYLQILIDPPALVRSYKTGYQSEIVKQSDNEFSARISSLEIVKKYMQEEINSIRETRHNLKKQYPELFSLYVE